MFATFNRQALLAVFLLSLFMIRFCLFISIFTMALFSCSTIPKGLKAVKPFDTKKYLGTWYEIARFDYRFERNMNNVTATYSLRKDGLIKVDNKGFDYVRQKWKQSVGKAKPAGDPQTGMLKVSFFGPFYAGYNVIAIDPDYQYALIAGASLDYLWILSRTPDMPEKIRTDYIAMAEKAGYNTSGLIWVKHDK